MAEQVRTVFLSSTAKDLRAFRDAVHEALLRMDGIRCVRMEDFGARDAMADDFCRASIGGCDLAVFIVGLCYGSSPAGSERSYTGQEYAAVKAAEVPRLVFLSQEAYYYTGYYREADALWESQQQFRARLSAERIRDTFTEADELAAKVATAVSNWAREHPRAPGGGSELRARVQGSGAIAHGDGAIAVGAGGTAIGVVHGDVHIGARALDPAPVSALREAYLNRVLERSRELSLSAIDPSAAGAREGEARLSLDAVYTALLTRTPAAPDLDRAKPLAGRGAEPRPLSALEQLGGHEKLVLLGDPGSGKSTFLSFVALCMAGELLGNEQINLERLTAPLPDKNGKDKKTPQQWAHGSLLPVTVVLRDFAATGLPPYGQQARAQHLSQFIESELEGAALGDYVPHLRKELLERGGLLLFDGLDEVPEAEQRRLQVQQAVEDFAQSFPKCRVLVTSRSYAYWNQGWRLQGFGEAVLAPFSDGQIRRFVSRWYRHVAQLGKLGAEDAEGRAGLLEQAIFSRHALRELAERPLLLTLMASLHAWRGGSLPEGRERLYADALDLLLNLWEERHLRRDARGHYVLLQPSLAEYLKLDRGKVRGVLEALAFDAHRSQPELVGTADIAEGALVAQLLRAGGNPDARPGLLVDYLRERAGVLYPRGAGVYTFPHRSFQEYLAACHLTTVGFPEDVATLVRAEPNRWREVALLAAAKAARGTQASLWQLVDHLCYGEPGALTTDDIWGAQIAAQTLLESADLAHLSPANHGKLERVKDWLPQLMRSGRFAAPERALAGDNLGRLGDQRPEAMSVGGMMFCLVPAGPFWMGSEEGEEGAFGDESPRREYDVGYDCWMGRYPVTVAQFRSYVKATSIAPGDAGALRGLSNHPVVRVSFGDALEFCRWLTERWRREGRLPAGFSVTLPSEPEWEKAARGGLQVPEQPVTGAYDPGLSVPPLMANPMPARRYPWGERPDPERANYATTGISATSALGCFPGGASPYGCEELCGNVWEWTRSRSTRSRSGDYPYPANETVRRAREDVAVSDPRVLRGGAFGVSAGEVRCAFRFGNLPGLRNDDIGFRVVVSPSFSARLMNLSSGGIP